MAQTEIKRLLALIAGLEGKIAELEAVMAEQAAELEELRAWKEAKLNEWKPTYVDTGMVAREPVSASATQVTPPESTPGPAPQALPSTAAGAGCSTAVAARGAPQ